MPRVTSLLIVVSVLVSIRSHERLCAEPIEWKVAEGGNGHFYDLVLERGKSWEASQADAQAMIFNGVHGHLATLTSQAENDFIAAHFRNDFDGTSWVWLGGFQDTTAADFGEPDGGWRWITEEPWSFTNWHPGEPNNQPLPPWRGEDYLTLYSRYTWNDLQGQVFDTVGYYVEFPVREATTPLQAGDANQDLTFDQADILHVLFPTPKYLTGQPATWGEGDWNGAPGGRFGNPPEGDGVFDQLDLVAAQQTGFYLTGPYAVLQPTGRTGDGQTSVVYDAASGELRVDTPAGTELTSINVDSASGIFTGQAAQNLGGTFDNDDDINIFKATFGGSFGAISFGNVAQPGRTEEFVLGDLTVIGSLLGGGGLGEVDLVYVPEPSTLTLLAMAIVLSSFRKIAPESRDRKLLTHRFRG